MKQYFLFLTWRQKRSADGNCTFRNQFGIFANNLGEKKGPSSGRANSLSSAHWQGVAKTVSVQF
jgi:hypothetical protein